MTAAIDPVELCCFGVIVRDNRPASTFQQVRFVWATDQHDATLKALGQLRHGTIGWWTAVEVFVVGDTDIVALKPDLKALAKQYWDFGRRQPTGDDEDFDSLWRELGITVEP